MNRIIKSGIAMVLCLAMTIGFFGGLSGGVVTVEAAGSNSTPVSLLKNYNFENSTLTGWKDVLSGTTLILDSDAWEGRYALRVTDSGSGVIKVAADRVRVAAEKTYVLSFMFKELSSVSHETFLIVTFYNSNGQSVASTSSRIEHHQMLGDWNLVMDEVFAPKGAYRAEVSIATGNTDATVFLIDEVMFYAKDDIVYPGVNLSNWKLEETSHPRLFFNAQELESLKTLARSEAVNVYGTTGKAMAQRVLDEADAYVAETRIDRHDWDVVPKLEYPTGSKAAEWYMRIQPRMEILSLAYALTGENKYADRAIQYACDIVGWSQKLVALEYGHTYMGVAAVYDMCYNRLVELGREEELRTGILNKMADPSISFDVHNVQLYPAAAMLSCSVAIINNSNFSKVAPYLEKAYYFAYWLLNYTSQAAELESLHYLDYCLEPLMMGLDAVGRATSLSSMADHPYYTETLIPAYIATAAPGTWENAAYSDAHHRVYAQGIFSILNKTLKSPALGYYLAQTGLDDNLYRGFIYADVNMIVGDPDKVLGNVVVTENAGYGGMRTGWDDDDMLLTLLANKSTADHNHFDQNSFALALAGSWVVEDPAYASFSLADRTFHLQHGHNTILVDGIGQMTKGQGTLSSVFENNSLYGYLLGSAPDAYGYRNKVAVLDKFDRHAIMINHSENPYYVLIDDLASSQNHAYNWQINGGKFTRLDVDGQTISVGESATGNTLAMRNNGKTLFVNFAGAALKTEVKKDTNGVTIRTTSEAAKNYQYMSFVSATDGRKFIDFTSMAGAQGMMNGASRGVIPGQIGWKTSSNPANDIVKNVKINNQTAVFFRSPKAGDYIQFPFHLDEGGNFDVSVALGQSDFYSDSEIIIDGVSYGVFDVYGNLSIKDYSVGRIDLAAGDHVLTVKAAGNLRGGVLTCQGISLSTGEADMVSNITLTENYDTANVLGAKVSYAKGLNDVVLFNRGSGSVAAGGVVTDGEQASVMGIDANGNVTEGYAVTNATTLTYNGKELFKSRYPVDIAVQFVNSGINIEIRSDNNQTVTLYGGETPIHLNVSGVTCAGKTFTATVSAGTTSLNLACAHKFDQEVADLAYLCAGSGCTTPPIYYKSCVCGLAGLATFEGGETLGHTWIDAKCYAPKTCVACGITDGEALGHEWVDADCTTAKTCDRCGATEGRAPGHTWKSATLLAPKTCTVCGATEGAPIEIYTNSIESIEGWSSTADDDSLGLKAESYNGAAVADGTYLLYAKKGASAPTIYSPKIVLSEGAVYSLNYYFGHSGAATVYLWHYSSDSSKTVTATYDYTGWKPTLLAREHEAVALPEGYTYSQIAVRIGSGEIWLDNLQFVPVCSHDWADATCTAPRTCSNCGATEGEALSHIAGADATCTNPQTCTVCGTELKAANGHAWVDATFLTPKTCTVCGATEGDVVKSYTDSLESLDGWTVNADDATLTLSNTSYNGAAVADGKNLLYAKKGASAPYVYSPKIYLTEGAEYSLNYYFGHSGVAAVYIWHYSSDSSKTVSASYEYTGWKPTLLAREHEALALPEGYTYTQVAFRIGSGEIWVDSLQFIPVCEHIWTDATCTTAKTCELCGETEGEALGHTWVAADCTNPKTCSACGEVEGEALGHTAGTAATCTDAQVCTVCGAELAAALGHTWKAATFLTPKTCTVCGATEGRPIETYTDSIESIEGWASNTNDASLSLSNTSYNGAAVADGTYLLYAKKGASAPTIYSPKYVLTEGADYSLNYYFGHSGIATVYLWHYSSDSSKTVTVTYDYTGWKPTLLAREHEAVALPEGYTYSQIAIRIGSGEIWLDNLQFVPVCDHEWTEASCAAPKTCSICGKTEGEALEHTWTPATTEAPKTCTVCGATEGRPIETYTDSLESLDGWTVNADDASLGLKTESYGGAAVADGTNLLYAKKGASAPVIYSPKIYLTEGAEYSLNYYFGHSGAATVYLWHYSSISGNTVATSYDYSGWKPTLLARENEALALPEGYTYTQIAVRIGSGEIWLDNLQFVPVIPVECDHVWTDATCTAPKTCDLCGETEGEAAPHSWKAATCTEPRTCSVCGTRGYTDSIESIEGWTSTADDASLGLKTESYDGAAVADGTYLLYAKKGASAPTIYSPKYVLTEGANYSLNYYFGHSGAATVYLWHYSSISGNTVSATYDYSGWKPTLLAREHDALALPEGYTYTQIAVRIGSGEIWLDNLQFVGEALGHAWVDANCTTAKTCSVCGATEGEALGHTEGEVAVENNVAAGCVNAGSYDNVVYCSVCGEELSRETVTVEAKGHKAGADATCTEAQTCTVCGTILADALGHTNNAFGICSVCGNIEQVGFVTNENGTFYLNADGSVVTGFTKIGDDYYYFHNATGKMYADTNRYLNADLVAGTDLAVGSYYFDTDGKMVVPEAPKTTVGWDGDYYYDENGEKVTGLQYIDGSYYFFHQTTGELRRKRVYIGANEYGLKSGNYDVEADGKLIIPEGNNTGWSDDGNYYYVDGEKLTGLQYIDRNYYYFHLITGELRRKSVYIGANEYGIAPGTYEVGTDGRIAVTAWSADGNYYLVNGEFATGLQYIDGNYYYFHLTTGVLRRKSVYIGANEFGIEPGTYDVGTDGKIAIPEDLKNGWSADGNYYYVNGEIVTGLQLIDGKYYYFNPSGGALRKKSVFIGDNQALPRGTYEVDSNNGYALIVG